MNLWTTLPVRYLLGRKLRTTLTTFAVVFGVAVIFGMNALLPTMLSTLQSGLLGAAGQVDLTVSSAGGEVFSAGALADVRAAAGVAAAAPVLRRQIVLPMPIGPATSSELVGVEPASAGQVRSYMVTAGRFLIPDDGQAAVLTAGAAQPRRITVGDHVQVPTPRGLLSLPVVGIVNLPGSDQVIIPLALAQELFTAADHLTTIDVALRAGANKDAVTRDLQARLGPAYRVGSPVLETETFGTLQVGIVAINFFGVLTLFMGGFLIFNTFRTVVVERRHDIGMLRAVGATRGIIIRLILAESLLQGVVGTLVGLVLGYGLALILVGLLNGLISQFMRVRIEGALIIPPEAFVLAAGLGLGVTLLAGLMPAIGASRVPVLAVIKAQDPPPVGRVSRGTWVGGGLLVLAALSLVTGNANLGGLGALLFLAGLVLLAPALVNPLARVVEPALLRVFPGEGTMATGNLQRHPNRAAVTASALMIGLAVIVALSGVLSSIERTFISYLDRSLAADVILVPGSLGLWNSNVGAGAAFEQQFAAIPGVGDWASLRYAAGQANGVAVQMLGINPATYPRLAPLTFDAGGPAAYDELAAGRGAIVNPLFAGARGLHVGDTMQVLTADGPQPYRIAAIAGDYLAAKINTLYISQANMAADFHRNEDILVVANLAPGANRDQVKADMERLLASYPQFTLNWGADWRADQRQIFNQAFAGLYILLIMLTIPSLLGLINTLAINVLERTREIGVLRAVGATRAQIRRLVVAEALLLGAAGAALGLLGGLALGWAITGLTAAVFGSTITYSFPLAGILFALAMALILAIVASLLPARQAARVRIVQALQYE